MYKILLHKKYRLSIRTLSKVLFIGLFIVFSMNRCAFARVYDLGKHGNLYEIAEPDFLEVIKMKARALEQDSDLIKKKMRKKVESYRPQNAVDLLPAKKDRIRLVDMTYTLKWDITDGTGGIVYPKGFRFNPLEYVPFNEIIVVLNGAREGELQWFLASEYVDDPGVKVLLTLGKWEEVKKRLGRHVYYLTDFMAKRLHIEATPSVIRAKSNKYMEVREFKVEKNEEVGK